MLKCKCNFFAVSSHFQNILFQLIQIETEIGRSVFAAIWCSWIISISTLSRTLFSSSYKLPFRRCYSFVCIGTIAGVWIVPHNGVCSFQMIFHCNLIYIQIRCLKRDRATLKSKCMNFHFIAAWMSIYHSHILDFFIKNSLKCMTK